MIMKFVFEDLDKDRNFISCPQKNPTGWERFCTAPFFTLSRFLSCLTDEYGGCIREFSLEERPEKYIIATGVHNDPRSWGGGTSSGHGDYMSIFECINETYLSDLQNKNALLIIDNSLEGFHDDWIFQFLHSECEKYSIPPSSIIYITGNLNVRNSYNEWIGVNPQLELLHPFEYPHFQTDVLLFSQELPTENTPAPPTFEEQLEYKKSNLENIKLFSYLNLKPRIHRIQLYILLYFKKLLNKGMVSLEDFGSLDEDFKANNPSNFTFGGKSFSQEFVNQVKQTLPSRIDGKSNREPGIPYVTRFHPNVALNSWVQVVSETYFYENSNTLFVSEKTFKVIASSQPFIIFGNKGSLRELKKLGYKTFDKWWDESYDEMDDNDRINAIAQILEDVDKIENKVEWFAEMKEVLEHNKKLLEINTLQIAPSVFHEVRELYNKL